MHKTTIPLLLTTLLLAGSAASAQTALIAHRSHGGAARTFRPDASAHNFGIPPNRRDQRIEEKFVWLDGPLAVYSGRWADYRGKIRTDRPAFQDTIDLRRRTGQPDPTQALQWLRKVYPNAKFVGFDKQKMQGAWPDTK